MIEMQDWEEALNQLQCSTSVEEKPDANGAEAAALPTLVAPNDATLAKKAFYAEMQQEVKQRMSTRVVKRKKFDDEILEAPTLNRDYQRTSHMDIAGEKATKSQARVGQSYFSLLFPPKLGGFANRNKAQRLPRKFATLNLGRWKPLDDYKLIENVIQTNDLSAVHRGTTFSCDFTFEEVKARWCTFLYTGSVSQTSAAAIRNLHPEMKAAADRHILYSEAEEKALARFKSTDKPVLADFEELLRNTNIFHASRTAKRLQTHWLGMKDWKLLPDQHIEPTLLSFEEAEELIMADKLPKEPNEAVQKECQLLARDVKRKDRLLQGQIAQLNVLVDAVIGGQTFSNPWDLKTVAALRGRHVNFFIFSKEVSFGRRTPDNHVDMDMSLEGPTNKMSRRQGIIRLRSNGDFFMLNEGNHPLYVNGMVLGQCEKTRLTNNSVLDICGLSFVFLVNKELIEKVRQHSATTTRPLK